MPKDETIKVKLGDVFDVVAERKQTDWSKISDDVYEVAFEITLRNHKDEPIAVSVIEPLPLDWEIKKSSHPHTHRTSKKRRRKPCWNKWSCWVGKWRLLDIPTPFGKRGAALPG
jgi:hypothetical protein